MIYALFVVVDDGIAQDRRLAHPFYQEKLCMGIICVRRSSSEKLPMNEEHLHTRGKKHLGSQVKRI